MMVANLGGPSKLGQGATPPVLPLMKTSRLPGFIALVLSAALPLCAESPVGQFTDHGDVGAPKIAGSAGYDAATQEYTLSGSGANIWGGRDEFQFAHRKIQGDFILRARVEFLGAVTDPHRKIGWMVRSTLDADAPYVDAVAHGEGLTSLQFRREKGGETRQFPMAISKPDVSKLMHGRFTGY